MLAVPTSSEFVALCRSQMAMLGQGLGASSSVVYLTEELVGNAETKLIPVAAYPESAIAWEDASRTPLLPPPEAAVAKPLPRLLSSSASLAASADGDSTPLQDVSNEHRTDAHQTDLPSGFSSSLPQQCQIVLPLMHEGVVMGLLVTTREHHPWSPQEQIQLEQIARTLAIARIMDQRAQWVEQNLRQKRLIQAQQQDILHDLLHQFRNPLTALKTFGKLLVKRLESKDANHKVAAGIVRESDRLQELLKQFDSAVDLGKADLAPRALNPALASLAQAAHVEPFTDESAQQIPPADVLITPVPGPLPLLPGSGLGANLTLTPCQVIDILVPLLASAEAIAHERQLILQANLPPSLPPVWADAKALREVLSNLIDNALKYAPSGAWIYIQAGIRPVIETNLKQTSLMQALVIADTGPGIPKDDLNHIFERHYRGIQAQTEIPGTGLGLAIAQELITQMQGQIQVISPVAESQLIPPIQVDPKQKLGPGTAFVVWLQEVEVKDDRP
ncbi:MAG: GAF domain-containing protein [Cyanothece sp. SIO1E1]|nr:GAF domain-containing protein [Cyanothece sp. SIO1E1]